MCACGPPFTWRSRRAPINEGIIVLPPIVCVSNAEWDAPIPTNRQQVMRRFATRTQVAYIESPLPVAGSLIGRSRKRTFKHAWRIADGVHVLQAWDWLPYPITKRSKTLSRWMDHTFRAYVTRAWRELGWSQPVVWFYAPDGGDLLGSFDERLSVYHCVDNYQAIERYNHYRRVAIYNERKEERYLASAVDLMIVTSPSLLERWRGVNPNVELMPNVADTALFSQALAPGSDHSKLAGIAMPRVVFLGALDRYKVDFELLGAVAQLLPEVQFVCVGPIGTADSTTGADVPRAPNLHYTGPLSQHDLPAVLRYASAGIIPYRINDYTNSVSPLKLYEYLAAGNPVVTTPLPGLLTAPEDGVLVAAPDPAAFAVRIVEAIRYDPAARRRVSQHACTHSWERRMEELESLLLGRLREREAVISHKQLS
jgi:glycosyltransferase involved in cell wall biosynthesis